MRIISSPQEMQTQALAWEKAGVKVGFVPTMGYLHEGHLSLIDLIREQSDQLIVSIFVNPTQFGVGEDLEKYPRDMERDLALCESRKVDLVFAPSIEDIYPPDASTFVGEEKVSTGLCGQARPTHFKGVTTICAKLFNLCRPQWVALGQKDAQQVVVLKRMIRDLHLPIEVVIGPTLREPDGLAMSSRNNYLNERQRKDALLINQSLLAGESLVKEKGVRNVDRIKAEVMTVLREGSLLRVNYAEVVNRETMGLENEIELGRSMLVVAAWVDSIRLIDNRLLG
jgi:pantoate--beta-alanine ligase